jgi:hypothetical protein
MAAMANGFFTGLSSLMRSHMRRLFGNRKAAAAVLCFHLEF